MQKKQLSCDYHVTIMRLSCDLHATYSVCHICSNDNFAVLHQFSVRKLLTCEADKLELHSLLLSNYWPTNVFCSTTQPTFTHLP